MALYFRKRVKIAPGLRVNFSKRGVSTTIGRRGLSITKGKRGTHLNASIPGTGLYTRKKINFPSSQKPSQKSAKESTANTNTKITKDQMMTWDQVNWARIIAFILFLVGMLIVMF